MRAGREGLKTPLVDFAGMLKGYIDKVKYNEDKEVTEAAIEVVEGNILNINEYIANRYATATGEYIIGYTSIGKPIYKYIYNTITSTEKIVITPLVNVIDNIIEMYAICKTSDNIYYCIPSSQPTPPTITSYRFFNFDIVTGEITQVYSPDTQLGRDVRYTLIYTKKED